MNSVFFVAVCIWIYAVVIEGSPQFYYTIPAEQAVSASPYFGAPVATSYVSNSFGPSPAYYTTQTFGSLQGYQTFAEHSSHGQVPAQQVGSVFAQVPTTTVFSTGPIDQYRGFAYHTQSTNGASANVFFLTGPEAHQIGHLASKIALNRTESRSAEKAKKLASDTVDSNATDKNQQQQIVETLNGQPQGPAFDVIRSFFENPQIGFHNFYASNGQIFAKSVDNQNLNVPASTVLLPAPISVQAFGNFGLLSRFGQTENVTAVNATSEKLDKADKGEEPAESVVTDVKIKPEIKTNETEADVSSNSTTEASSTPSITGKSKEETAPTIKEARSLKEEIKLTKDESSTQKRDTSESTMLEATPKASGITKTV